MYCLQKRMRATKKAIVGVSRGGRPGSDSRSSWAQVSWFQKRTLSSPEVLVGVSRAGRLGWNAAILMAYEERTEVARRTSHIRWDSRVRADCCGSHLVYGRTR